MADLRISCLGLLVACCCWSSALAVCAVNDASFTTADGGCKDLNTGLVWSSDVLGLSGNNQYPHGTNAAEANGCGGLSSAPEGGGFTDWRLPTVGEVQDALANGLNSHLDFYYASGSQPVDAEYRWTRCEAPKVRGAPNKYLIRYTDGKVIQDAFASHQVICVRGLAADNDCPAPGKKKNRSGANSALSQTSTGALLLLPLAVVLATRCVYGRRT